MAQEANTNTRLNQIGAALVIFSYFLVWHKSWFSSETGFTLLGEVLKGMKDMKGDGALLGLGMVLFITSPIVCHAINLWIAMTSENKKSSFISASIPAAIWIGIVLILLAKSNGDASILKVFFPHEIGAVLSMVGMSVCLIFSWLDFSDKRQPQAYVDSGHKNETVLGPSECPHCNGMLSSFEIKRGMCAYCKKAL